MSHVVKISDLLASENRVEFSHIHLDPEKSAQTLGFEWSTSENGAVGHAAFKGESFSPDTMESLLESLTYSFYDNNSKKFMPAFPLPVILRLFGIRVVDDVGAQPVDGESSDRNEHDVNLSELLATGWRKGISRTYLKSDETLRALGFDWTMSKNGRTTRATFGGQKIKADELHEVRFSLIDTFYDNLTGEIYGSDSFFEMLRKYGIQFVDDVRTKAEGR